MGARFWSYLVPYQQDIWKALEDLREQEFQAGRFHQPSEIQPGFFGRLLGRKPAKPKSPTTIREAIKIADANAIGTRSVLDMERIADIPTCGAVWLVSQAELRRIFGTDRPNREMVEQCEELLGKIGSGQGIGIVTYRGELPDGIYFAGYSYD